MTSKTELPSSFPKITEEALDYLRQFLNVEMPARDPFNRYASPDTIRHFAHAIGDPNPLFTDEEYGSKTKWKSVIAPLTFLFSCFGRGAVHGLPGVHGMWAGTGFEMENAITSGTRIDGTVALSGLIPKETRFAGRAILQEHTFTFRDQNGKILARAQEWNMRSERDSAQKRGKYDYLEPATYTDADIKRIFDAYENEQVRGSTPRYWEDVVIGEELPSIVKGPLRVTDNIAWKIGWGFRPFAYAHKLAYEYYKKHPKAFILNQYGIPDVPERVHWDNDFAQRVGVPVAYDFGPQRISWMGQVVTNWMGDDGFFQKLNGQVRRFNLVNDTTWLKGKVINKSVEKGQHLVEIELWGNDQRDEVTIRGKAVAALPSKGK